MARPVARYTVRIAAVFLVIFALICVGIIHRQQQTVWNLLHPTTGPVTTDVYAAWTELSPAHPITFEHALALLNVLNYEAVTQTPTTPGRYQISGSVITLFERSFVYPDQALPDQVVRLKFSSGKLSALEDAQGKTMTEYRLEPKRLAQWVSPDSSRHPQVILQTLPPYMGKAVVAVEDKRFYRHGAFDGIGILRAVWVDLRHRHWQQGGSTISQQLARSIFLNVDRTIQRKVLEAALAFYLELRYSKAQLLEMYLNQVYWGKDGGLNLLGVEATSQTYFGKPAISLTLAESALLAGLLESPNRLSPRRDAVASMQRRNTVLRLMLEQKLITLTEVTAALNETLRLAPLVGHAGSAPYFLATLQDQLADRYSLPQLLTQRWRIFTTLDPLLQSSAEEAVTSLATSNKAPQGALVAMDPETGAVRAYVGGTNYQTSPFDRALYAYRQPGSAFKPFVALAAIESKKATTATLLDDSPLTVRAAGERWSPQNYDHTYVGKISMWDSLIHSRNVPMVRLALQIGLPTIVVAAHQAGITSQLRPVPSLALGTSEVSLFELTHAYGTLANKGIRVEPYTIEAILDSNGVPVESHTFALEKVFSPEATAIVTQMLQKVIDEGTAKSARSMGQIWPVAGKTGTAENYQDAWFMGYSSGIVCGVWVGYDQPKSLGHAAAGIALPVWVRFMTKALTIEPPGAFAVPTDLVWKTIDPESGLLVRSGCKQRRSVAFVPGTDPKQLCPIHRGGLFGFFKRWTS